LQPLTHVSDKKPGPAGLFAACVGAEAGFLRPLPVILMAQQRWCW